MKLAILGTGKIVQELLPVIAPMNVELRAILSTQRSRQRAYNLARQYHIQQCCFAYEDILQSDADTVYIALPNHLHFQYAKEALLSGKHVIVEKPITANAQQLQMLRTLANEKNCILLEAITTHYLPAYRKIKQDLARLGTVRIVNLNFSQYSSRYDDFLQGIISPVFDPDMAGGALMDLNVYNIHFVVGLFGKPDCVQYYPNMQNGVDTSGILVLDYGQMKAVCIGAKDCYAPANSAIQGELGTITLHQPANQLYSYTVQGQSYCFDEGKHRMYYEFVDFIQTVDQKNIQHANNMLDISEIAVQILDKRI